MNYDKLKEILNNGFSKLEIESFLGKKLCSAIIEWSDSEESNTKTSLVELLVNIYGYEVFKNIEFRKRFFKSVPKEDLAYLLDDYDSEYSKLADKASRIDFSNQTFYSRLIKDYFDCKDYNFVEYNPEPANEEINGSNNKFFELFDYQYLIKQQAVFELSKTNNRLGRKILIHMPTGTGKTKTTMHIIAHYLNFINIKGFIVWIAHTNVLLEQALDSFRSVWGHLGLSSVPVQKSWGVDKHEINNGIMFTTIQSLQSMKKNDENCFRKLCDSATLIVYDECHKIGAEETNKVITELSKSTSELKKDFIGLTATPGRTTEVSLENRIFNEFFDRKIEIDIDLVKKISQGKFEAIHSSHTSDVIAYFQQRKILSKLQKEQIEYDIPDEIVKLIKKESSSRDEDYSDALINIIAENKARNTAILNRLKVLNQQCKPTIVFACSLDHAKMLSAFLNIENIPNALVHGKMLQATRQTAISSFKDRNNPVNIIINYDVLTTGFDSTNIECVFITRPTKSVILYSQMIGRGLRGPMMGGGEKCLLIDVKDNLSAFNENEAFSHFNNYWR